MLITIINTLLITMQNVFSFHLLFCYIKIGKYHYFLKYLKRYPQYESDRYNPRHIVILAHFLRLYTCLWGQEKYKDINI